MSRTIVQTGEAVLRMIAKEIPISDIGNSSIQSLINDMRTLLAKENYGVALAAPQVGESLRLFIVSGAAIRKRSSEPPETTPQPVEDSVYINPVIIKMSRTKKDKHEGCLSVRGKWGMVPRADKATIEAYNEKGEKFTRGASGLLAHIFQHEIDHLNGILYIDKATDLYDDQPAEK